MAKKPTLEIAAPELDELFVVLGLWEKIRNGRTTSEPVESRARPSHGFPGGLSDIVRHRNQLGYHVATSHRITMPDGAVPHWDGKNVHIGDIVIWCV